MNKGAKTSLIVPILVITVGVGWLLTVQGYVPGINWLWTLGLGVAGILVFVLSGVDKVSIVVGPFFLIASIFSVLRQREMLKVDLEVPVMVIVLGFLLLLARSGAVQSPGWMIPLAPRDGEKDARKDQASR